MFQTLTPSQSGFDLAHYIPMKNTLLIIGFLLFLTSCEQEDSLKKSTQEAQPASATPVVSHEIFLPENNEVAPVTTETEGPAPGMVEEEAGAPEVVSNNALIERGAYFNFGNFSSKSNLLVDENTLYITDGVMGNEHTTPAYTDELFLYEVNLTDLTTRKTSLFKPANLGRINARKIIKKGDKVFLAVSVKNYKPHHLNPRYREEKNNDLYLISFDTMTRQKHQIRVGRTDKDTQFYYLRLAVSGQHISIVNLLGGYSPLEVVGAVIPSYVQVHVYNQQDLSFHKRWQSVHKKHRRIQAAHYRGSELQVVLADIKNESYQQGNFTLLEWGGVDLDLLTFSPSYEVSRTKELFSFEDGGIFLGTLYFHGGGFLFPGNKEITNYARNGENFIPLHTYKPDQEIRETLGLSLTSKTAYGTDLFQDGNNLIRIATRYGTAEERYQSLVYEFKNGMQVNKRLFTHPRCENSGEIGRIETVFFRHNRLYSVYFCSAETSADFRNYIGFEEL